MAYNADLSQLAVLSQEDSALWVSEQALLNLTISLHAVPSRRIQTKQWAVCQMHLPTHPAYPTHLHLHVHPPTSSP
jgi:hypothetical protein